MSATNAHITNTACKRRWILITSTEYIWRYPLNQTYPINARTFLDVYNVYTMFLFIGEKLPKNYTQEFHSYRLEYNLYAHRLCFLSSAFVYVYVATFIYIATKMCSVRDMRRKMVAIKTKIHFCVPVFLKVICSNKIKIR